MRTIFKPLPKTGEIIFVPVHTPQEQFEIPNCCLVGFRHSIGYCIIPDSGQDFGHRVATYEELQEIHPEIFST